VAANDSVPSSNVSDLAAAVKQALAQINSIKDISAYFNAGDSQQAASDFTSNLLSNLPGFSSSADLNPAQSNTNNQIPASTSTQNSTQINLDPNSSSYKLQASIQKFISALDTPDSANQAAGLGSLNSAFNTLIEKTGGEPSAQSLQSFLKLVAVNVQGSTSIGSLFSTSA
jgi:hypothetical protein